MEQPVLPEIKPYVNRNLFSLHFLEEVLPQDDSWAVEEHDVRLAMQATLNLYAPRKDDLPQLSEAQLEQEFVRPLLEALGHRFQVQPSLPTPEGVRRPDYAFFATDEDKRQALRKHKGKLEYFKRAVAIGDAKHWGRPLDKRQRAGTDKFDILSPSWQIDYYLRTSDVRWGILTDGRFWRLYNRETSFRLDVFYEVDLPQVLAQRDTEAFKYFYLFFRREAFVRDAEGLCFLDRVYQGSLEYARAVGDDLKENVYKALRVLAEGFVNTPGNDLDAQFDTEAIHDNSLVYLYRLLFINYAEDRGLLPRENPLYKETYGLVSMEREIASKMERQQSLSPLQATYWEKLRALFDLVNRGSDAFRIDKDTLFVPPYNGGLFDPERHGFLEKNKVADRWLAQVIDLLARSKGEGAGRAFVDYTSLDVRHLGSIYEGLLEYKLRVADHDMVAVKRRKREEWVPAEEAEGKKVIERVEAGGLYLATDRGERKATGSYYTPDYIVKYIVENTLGPLIEEKVMEEDPIEGIRSLKVLDPAMGSGHFLVEATDRLAHALVQALGGSEEEAEEEDVRWARREVVERCIYGVDVNPLAVELAKLSLWLHTVAEGKPLSFLDHHLKVGNSLIGAWVDDLGSLPVRRKRGKTKDAETDARQMNLFEIRLDEKLPVMLNRVLEIIRGRSETLDDIKKKAAADQAVEELKAPFKAVADLWVSTYFGNEVTQGEYQGALEYIGEPTQLLGLPSVRQAERVAHNKHFFHWELEFPEVFYEDGARSSTAGFDAVVGNPPYVFIVSVPGDDRDYFFDAFATCEYRFDVYGLFTERGLSILARGGHLGYIVPHSMLNNNSFEKLRAAVVQQASHVQIIDFTDRVFLQAANEPMLLLVQSLREGHQQVPRLEAARIASTELSTVEERLRQYPASVVERLPGRPFIVCGGDWLDRMLDNPDTEPLGSTVRVTQGLRTGDNTQFLTFTPSGPLHRRVLAGADLHRYGLEWPGTYVLYDRQALDAPRSEVFWAASEKIVVQEVRNVHLPRRIVGSIDVDRFIGLNSTNAMILRPRARVSLYYVMAVISSSLVNEFFRACFVDNHIATQYLQSIPIRHIVFSTSAEDRKRLTDHAQAVCVADDQASLLSLTDACLAAQPAQADVIHDLLANLAQQMTEMNKERQAEADGFVGWVGGYTGLPIEEWRLKTIVKAYWEHGWDEVRRALRQNRKAIHEASERDVEGREAVEAIQREFEQSVARLRPLLERIASTDRLIDLIVYRLYGLTEEEVAIVEESATR